MHLEVTQVPEGALSEVHPVYWVTFLTARRSALRASLEPEHLRDWDVETTYKVTGAGSAFEVVQWARDQFPDEGLVLAEVHVSAGTDGQRCRIWVHRPDTPWARAAGEAYTP